MSDISREEAFALLKKYNQDPFHIQHALTVEAVMKWYARELGYGAEEKYWGVVFDTPVLDKLRGMHVFLLRSLLLADIYCHDPAHAIVPPLFCHLLFPKRTATKFSVFYGT